MPAELSLQLGTADMGEGRNVCGGSKAIKVQVGLVLGLNWGRDLVSFMMTEWIGLICA